jgi:hypothetical protein
MKVVLFNGPPRCGKDTAADACMKSGELNAVATSFAYSLKKATHALYGLNNPDVDMYEDSKDEPTDALLGKTPREAYIEVSEKLVKPNLGHDFFAKVAIKRLSPVVREDDLVVVSDCGFAAEARALAQHVGKDNILLARISREGCSFDGDSRSYIPDLEDFDAIVDLNNDEPTAEAFGRKVVRVVNSWLNL